MTEHHDTVIIGAGHAGLSVSRHLKGRGREHIILEKDRLGESWRSRRWDSFTLVTPNWSLRLPEFPYRGDNPDGYLARDEIVDYLERFAEDFDAPLHSGVEVTALSSDMSELVIETNNGTYAASNVVVAIGTFQKPNIPSFGARIAPHIRQIHSSQYRNPAALPSGAVLVIGSAQSGCQIADELRESGRTVYLSAGRADRVPRWYRGVDAFGWFDRLGLFSQTVDTLPSPNERFRPNPQVTGKNGGKSLGLHQLAADGVHLLGRTMRANGTTLSFAGDLRETLEQCDTFEGEFLKGVDALIEKTGLDTPEEKLSPLRDGYNAPPIAELDLDRSGITIIVWATGYRYDYSWIDAPIFDDAGYPVQERGVTRQPGLYFAGLHWQYTRKSDLFFGVGEDAAYVAEHIASHS